jgi:hypothetical protein
MKSDAYFEDSYLKLSVARVLAEMGCELGRKEAENLGISAANPKEAQELCGMGYRELDGGNYDLARKCFLGALRRDPYIPGPYEGYAEIPLGENILSIEYLPEAIMVGTANPSRYNQKGTRQTRRPESCGFARRPARKGITPIRVSLNIGPIGISLGNRRTSYYGIPPKNDNDGAGSLRQKAYPKMP